MTVHPAFLAAERLTPDPKTRDDATVEYWIRKYAALGLAAHTAFRDALDTLEPKPEPGSRPDLGHLSAIATSATAAAVALTGHIVGATGTAIDGELWDLTPELGALNGEYYDWLTETLDAMGINPADIDHHLDATDFESRSGGEAERPELVRGDS